jgi:hypothetical protein
MRSPLSPNRSSSLIDRQSQAFPFFVKANIFGALPQEVGNAMKKAVALALVVAALLTVNVPAALAVTGRGTQSDPYVISDDPDDLPQGFGHNFEGCWFERPRDVWLLVDGDVFESGEWKKSGGSKQEKQKFVKKKDFMIKAREGSFRLRAGVDWEVDGYDDDHDD